MQHFAPQQCSLQVGMQVITSMRYIAVGVLLKVSMAKRIQ